MRRKVTMMIFVTLVWLMTIPQLATAREIDWRINWQENGSLREEVYIAGTDIVPADPSWQLSREGEFNVWRRTVPDWLTYQKLRDGLPLQVQQRNFVVWQQTVLSINPAAGGGLWAQLKDSDAVRLTISAPGIISSPTIQRVGDDQATWEFPDSAALLQTGRLAQVITVDGLRIAIGIVVLGVLWIGIKFRGSIKKADQIIGEEYALPPKNSGPKPPDGQD